MTGICNYHQNSIFFLVGSIADTVIYVIEIVGVEEANEEDSEEEASVKESKKATKAKSAR